MNRIKQLREEFHLTQNDLAEKMDCASSSIAMYEREERKPSLDVLIKLSEIFSCSIDYLLGKSDIRNNGTLKLTDDEIYFIKHVKKLDENQKQIIKNTMEAFLDNKENNN